MPRRLGLRHKPRGGFTARTLLGAPPPDHGWGSAPNPVQVKGLGAAAVSGVWGGAPSYILAAKPPRGLWRSPNGRGNLFPPLATPLRGFVFGMRNLLK